VLCSCPDPNPKGTARFSKAARLRHRQDFLRAQAQGERLHTRHFGLVLAPMAAARPRLGLVVTRRLGKAVKRNRVKRLLREFFRRHQTELPAADLVIMAKKGAAALGYRQVEEELSRLLLTRARKRIHD
jgi:ribonuclease P protein component